MKAMSFLAALCLSLSFFSGYSQAPVAPELSWTTDYQKALQEATSQNKTVLLNFTGSDWCGWCIRLHNEVFSKPEFMEWAGNNLVCVKLDFPRRTVLEPALVKQNEGLAQKFGITGFPTIVLVDGTGKAIGRTGYKAGGPAVYIEHLKTFIGAKK